MSNWSWQRLIPALGIMGLIFFLSHQPGQSLSLPLPQFLGVDKLAHFLIYALLAVAVIHAIPAAFCQKRPWTVMLGTTLFCLLYGISDELHQYFIPGRTSSIADLMADGAGGLSAALIRLGTFALPLGDDKTRQPHTHPTTTDKKN